MTVSQSLGSPLLESVLRAQSARSDASVAMLAKAQEVTRQQGAAMVDLLEQAQVDPRGPADFHLDAYA